MPPDLVQYNRWFRQSSFQSFARQLCNYGFKKIYDGSTKTKQQGPYYHELFRRDAPHLSERIVRRKKAKPRKQVSAKLPKQKKVTPASARTCPVKNSGKNVKVLSEYSVSASRQVDKPPAFVVMDDNKSCAANSVSSSHNLTGMSTKSSPDTSIKTEEVVTPKFAVGAGVLPTSLQMLRQSPVETNTQKRIDDSVCATNSNLYSSLTPSSQRQMMALLVGRASEQGTCGSAGNAFQSNCPSQNQQIPCLETAVSNGSGPMSFRQEDILALLSSNQSAMPNSVPTPMTGQEMLTASRLLQNSNTQATPAFVHPVSETTVPRTIPTGIVVALLQQQQHQQTMRTLQQTMMHQPNPVSNQDPNLQAASAFGLPHWFFNK